MSIPSEANASAKAVALLPDGRILVAGPSGSPGSSVFSLARLLPTGQLDSSFGQGGSVTTPFAGDAVASSLAETPDGKIVVAGYFDDANSISDSVFALVRYTADGSLDSGFGQAGKVTTKFSAFDAGANKVLVQADGSIIAVGHTSTSGGGFGFAIGRYKPDGSLDTSFHGTGTVTTTFGDFDDAIDAALLPDGSLVAVGSAQINGKVKLALAKYTPTGDLDSGFGNSGKLTIDLGGLNQAARAVAVQPDGKLVVAGVYAPQGPSQFFVARLASTGTLDATFGQAGVIRTVFDPASNASGNAVDLFPDGRIVVAGTSASDFALARYFGDHGPPDYALGTANAVYVNRRFPRALIR